MNLTEKIQQLKPYSVLLKDNLMGLEKEGLRVSRKGGISQAPHPKAFGCALTHPNITTDFSESLIELVTPPVHNAEEMLAFLSKTQQYLYHHLPKDQNFWPTSMPCVIRGETYIPIAQYGASNQGMMKTVYRHGLANRYGSVMQTIAGIHFNYSFSADFFKQYHLLKASNETLRDFTDQNYMALTRNVVRYGWLIPYLFGASSAVCKSFLKGYHQHSLVEFNTSTLYEPYATSLRMGDIGYQNLREDEAGVKANYNSLRHYIHSLKSGMQTSCDEYENIGLKKQGRYQQLNTNILQIENEYYASVRPKPDTASGKKPLDALYDNGIAYIELRSLDINPNLPLGIDKTQVLFLEAFLLFCLLEDSPIISSREQVEIDSNNQLVAHQGRQPNLVLMHQGQSILLQALGKTSMDKIHLCAGLLGQDYQTAVRQISKRITHTELTPSVIALNEMRSQNQGFFSYTSSLAKQHQKDFLAKEIDLAHFDYLDQQTKKSCEQQFEIEQADNMSFDDYLAHYFNP
ncbi:glutamate--cysteine ligase [Bathymodiolus heckerae thiotrophic gill symbiont]|uniref:glutamate--cysteine ligase n=1 Tax=Bathymodiolus heckerae thiotrophic gill symbiont TaxID=1052212 RepID=UPI0010FEEA0A|nr:glutamate--cysteine ligase [Bathymodiolus heckerae thiotrophic gill symbiont]